MSKTAQKLLDEIERFCVKHEMSATMFGKLAVNDGHLVHEMRDGLDLRSSRHDRIRDFMVSYRPLGQRRRIETRSAA